MKAKVDIKREVKTFWDLCHGSNVLLEKSKTLKEGSYYTTMASIMFSAFCFEAYLNHLGYKKIDFWNDIEKIKVMEKYSVLCKKFTVTPDWGQRPYQTLSQVFKFRNSIAHGKSKIIKSSKIVDANTELYQYEPKTKWEEYCTLDNAERAYRDISEVIEELNKAADEGDYAFLSGMTFGSMTIE